MKANNFYTAEEAIKVFEDAGLSENTFFRKVRNKEIDKLLPEGRERGAFYPKDQVEKAATRKRATSKKEVTKKRTVPPVIMDWVKPEDVPSGLALDHLVYHEMFLASLEVYQAWRRKNPKISMGAFDANDRRTRYGYIGFIPLPENIILDVLMGKKDEKEITPDEILTYDEPGEYTLLANSFVIHPDYPELGNRIIHSVMEYWVEQYPEKRIKRIYAQGVSDQGRNIIKKLYLAPLYIMGKNGLTRIEDAYVLDMQEKAVSKVIRAFQEDLEMKEQRMEATEENERQLTSHHQIDEKSTASSSQ